MRIGFRVVFVTLSFFLFLRERERERKQEERESKRAKYHDTCFCLSPIRDLFKWSRNGLFRDISFHSSERKKEREREEEREREKKEIVWLRKNVLDSIGIPSFLFLPFNENWLRSYFSDTKMCIWNIFECIQNIWKFLYISKLFQESRIFSFWEKSPKDHW